jgi:hypothetical protein
MAEPTVMRHRPWATAVAVLGLVMVVIYVTLILSEGGNSLVDILPWALLMAIAATMALASVFVSNSRVARRLLIGAAALFGLIGVLGILTIGIGFLLAAGVSLLGASKV